MTANAADIPGSALTHNHQAALGFSQSSNDEHVAGMCKPSIRAVYVVLFLNVRFIFSPVAGSSAAGKLLFLLLKTASVRRGVCACK